MEKSKNKVKPLNEGYEKANIKKPEANLPKGPKPPAGKPKT